MFGACKFETQSQNMTSLHLQKENKDIAKIKFSFLYNKKKGN